MKLIENKNNEVNLVWGNKYRLKGSVDNLRKSEIVLLISDGVDSDGEVEIATKDNSTWVEPIYLEEINQETLYPTDKEEDTLLVEVNFKELEMLSDCIDKAKVYSGYGLSSKKYADEVKESLDGLQKEIEDILRTKVN